MTVQETTEDIISRIADALHQRETSARAWERQSNEWEARWRAVTAERDALRAELGEGTGYLTRLLLAIFPECVPFEDLPGLATQIDHVYAGLRAELAAAHALIADLESRLGEAQQGLYVAEEQAGV